MPPLTGVFTAQGSGVLTCTPISNIEYAGNTSTILLLNLQCSKHLRIYCCSFDSTFEYSDVDPFVGSNNVQLNESTDKCQRRREQYSAMPEVQKSILLSKKRENYQRRKVIMNCTGGSNGDGNTNVGNDHIHDAYGLFEPDVHQTNGTYIIIVHFSICALIIYGIYIEPICLLLVSLDIVTDCLDTLQQNEAENGEPDEEARILAEKGIYYA